MITISFRQVMQLKRPSETVKIMAPNKMKLARKLVIFGENIFLFNLAKAAAKTVNGMVQCPITMK